MDNFAARLIFRLFLSDFVRNLVALFLKNISNSLIRRNHQFLRFKLGFQLNL